MQHIMVDAHEDIAWNASAFGRDYRQPLAALRASEGPDGWPGVGITLLGKDAWLSGGCAVIFATLFGFPVVKKKTQFSGHKGGYQSPADAYGIYMGQLDFYHRLVDSDPQFRLLVEEADLTAVLTGWEQPEPNAERQIGLLVLMEGAEGIRAPEELEAWYAGGVRIIGPTWSAGTRYAAGDQAPGPLTMEGRHLLEAMAGLNIGLDLSHMAEPAYEQALDNFEGVVLVSHANPRRFSPGSRGLSDGMIRRLAERGGVMGMVPYNRFLKPGWQHGDARDGISLETVADVIDHVCQVTGSAEFVGIGSDFDGGFGLAEVPAGIESIASLAKLRPLLAKRGYESAAVDGIMAGNFLRITRQVLHN